MRFHDFVERETFVIVGAAHRRPTAYDRSYCFSMAQWRLNPSVGEHGTTGEGAVGRSLSSREHATLPAQGQRSFRPAARFIRLLFTTVLR